MFYNTLSKLAAFITIAKFLNGGYLFCVGNEILTLLNSHRNNFPCPAMKEKSVE